MHNLNNQYRLSLKILMIVVGLWNVEISAQATTAHAFSDALKNIKQATGVCRKDDGFSNGTITSLPGSEPDLKCALPVTEVKSLLSNANTLLVDLRSNAEYQSFHINGALNLNTSDLHSKPYWRKKTVVLIGSGKAERELYSECTRLKQLGYQQVRVLRGGMLLWLASDQPVVGQAPATSQLARLPAAEFWLESQNSDNLVLLSKERSALRSDVSFSVALPQITGEAIKAILERRRKELKNAPLASVVLVAPSIITDEHINQLQKILLPVPLLVYTDTKEALQRQSVLQKSVWLAQARGPKQPGCGL